LRAWKAAELRRTARCLAKTCGNLHAEAEQFLSFGPGQEIAPEFPAAVAALFGLRKYSDKRAPPDPRIGEFFALRDQLKAANKAERTELFCSLLRAANAFEPLAQCFLQLAQEVAASLEQTLQSRYRISFSTLLRKTRDLMRDFPAVARAASTDISLLLVDEFQDTSKVQRDLVCLLWEAEPRRRPQPWTANYGVLRKTGLFIVGDRKQSIYGFRGASIATFAEVCVGLAGQPAAQALGLVGAVVNSSGAASIAAASEPDATADFVALQVNRRGVPALLAFTNRFCHVLFANPAGRDLRSDELAYSSSHEDLRAPPAGIEAAQAASADSAAIVLDCVQWLVPAGGPLASNAQSDGQAIAEDIAARAATGTAFRDFAVLARANSVLAAVACALEARGIPYVVAGGGFYRTKEVADIRALLRLLWDPADRLAFAAVLRGPLVGLTDDALLALVQPGKGLMPLGVPFSERPRGSAMAAEERAVYLHAEAILLRASASAATLAPAQMVRDVLGELGWFAVLAELPRGAQRLANVDKLLRALGVCPDLFAAILLLEQMQQKSAREEEAQVFIAEDNAVRLLTMHASKGLQFPHVFIPRVGAQARPVSSGFVYRDPDATPSAIALHLHTPNGARLVTPVHLRMQADQTRREAAEAKRLMYVAVTRAERTLTFVGRSRTSKDTSKVSAPLAAVLTTLATAESTTFVRELVASPAATPPRALDAAARCTESAEQPGYAASPPIAPQLAGATALSPTALSDFLHCARRFAFVHLWDIPEERPTFARPMASAQAAVASALGPGELDVDYRREGTLLHAVLEVVDLAAFGAPEAPELLSAALLKQGIDAAHPRHAVMHAALLRFMQSPYACALRAAGATLEREVEFEVRLGSPHNAILLRGSMDLLVRWPTGEVHVIDYKRARGPSISPYRHQLQSYKMAAEYMLPNAVRVRAGVFFLGRSDAPDVVFADEEAQAEERPFATRIPLLAQELVQARLSDHYPRAPQTVCKSLKCAYAPRCYPKPYPLAVPRADVAAIDAQPAKVAAPMRAHPAAEAVHDSAAAVPIDAEEVTIHPVAFDDEYVQYAYESYELEDPMTQLSELDVQDDVRADDDDWRAQVDFGSE
jgi:ATP-dependent helicase/nuclease subunit A